MITRTLVVWFDLLALAIANGGFRETVLVPRLGLGMARAVSSVMLSLLIVGVGQGVTRWRESSAPQKSFATRRLVAQDLTMKNEGLTAAQAV